MCATKSQREVPQHLYRPTHGRSLNWYVRLVPPSELKLTGIKEYRESTGTADLRKAKTIGSRLIAKKRAEWEHLSAKTKPITSSSVALTPSLIENICARRLYQWLHIDDLGRFEAEGFDDKTRESLSKIWKVTDQTMRSVLARGKASDGWTEALETVDFWCNQIDLPVSRTDPLYPKLVRDFARVELDALERVRKRNDGDPVATPPIPKAIGATLSAMTEVYRDYKRQTSGGKHVGTSVNVWAKLIQHLGDVPLSAVKSSDLYGFLEARMHAEQKPWSMKHSHGIVKRTLREIFAIARTRGMLEGGNPVDDLEVLPRLNSAEEKARRKPRHPFSDQQLTTLFMSDWYRRNATNWTGKMSTDLGARYWVPLVCMYHGNRVREVLQLIASDVSKRSNIPSIHFREELEGEQAALLAAGVTRSLKNDATDRVVPIHPTLLALGFMDFVKHRREKDGSNALLFPSSIPAPGGKTPLLGRSYEQAFLRFVRDDLEFGRGFGNHSFRHQLEDRIRDAQRPGQQWPAGLAQAYTGRKRVRRQDIGYVETEGSEADYGRGHSLSAILEYIQHLDYTGVTLPPPFTTWMGSNAQEPT